MKEEDIVYPGSTHRCTDYRIERRTDRQTDSQTDSQTDRQTDRQTDFDGCFALAVTIPLNAILQDSLGPKVPEGGGLHFVAVLGTLRLASVRLAAPPHAARLSMCVRLSACQPACRSVWRPVPVCLSGCLSGCLSLCLLVSLSACLAVPHWG